MNQLIATLSENANRISYINIEALFFVLKNLYTYLFLKQENRMAMIHSYLHWKDVSAQSVLQLAR